MQKLIDLSSAETMLTEVKSHIGTGKIVTLTHSLAGSVHQLTGELGSDQLVMAVFIPTGNYKPEHTFSVNGVTYTAETSRGDSLPYNIFVTGVATHVTLNTVTHKLTFDMAGEVGACNIWEASGYSYLFAGIIPSWHGEKALCSAIDQYFQMVGNGQTFLVVSQNGASFIDITIDNELYIKNLEGDEAFTLSSENQQIACTSKYFFLLRPSPNNITGNTHALYWYDTKGSDTQAGGFPLTAFDPDNPRIFTDPEGSVWVPILVYDENGNPVQRILRINADEQLAGGSVGGDGTVTMTSVTLEDGEVMCGVDDAGIYVYKLVVGESLTLRYIYHDGTPPLTVTETGNITTVEPYRMQNPDPTYVNLTIWKKAGSGTSTIPFDVLFSKDGGLIVSDTPLGVPVGIEGNHALYGWSVGSYGTSYRIYENLESEEDTILAPIVMPLRQVFTSTYGGTVVKDGTLYTLPRPDVFMVCRSAKVN